MTFGRSETTSSQHRSYSKRAWHRQKKSLEQSEAACQKFAAREETLQNEMKANATRLGSSVKEVAALKKAVSQLESRSREAEEAARSVEAANKVLAKQAQEAADEVRSMEDAVKTAEAKVRAAQKEATEGGSVLKQREQQIKSLEGALEAARGEVAVAKKETEAANLDRAQMEKRGRTGLKKAEQIINSIFSVVCEAVAKLSEGRAKAITRQSPSARHTLLELVDMHLEDLNNVCRTALMDAIQDEVSNRAKLIKHVNDLQQQVQGDRGPIDPANVAVAITIEAGGHVWCCLMPMGQPGRDSSAMQWVTKEDLSSRVGGMSVLEKHVQLPPTLDGKLRELVQERGQMQQQIAELQFSVNAEKEKVARAEEEHKNYKSMANKAIRQKETTLGEEVSSLRDRVASLQEALTEAQGDAAAARQLRSDLSQLRTTYDKETTDCAEKIKHLQTINEEGTRAREALQAQQVELKAQVEDLTASRNTIEAESNMKLAKAEETVSAATNSVKSLEVEVSSLKNKLLAAEATREKELEELRTQKDDEVHAMRLKVRAVQRELRQGRGKGPQTTNSQPNIKSSDNNALHRRGSISPSPSPPSSPRAATSSLPRIDASARTLTSGEYVRPEVAFSAHTELSQAAPFAVAHNTAHKTTHNAVQSSVAAGADPSAKDAPASPSLESELLSIAHAQAVRDSEVSQLRTELSRARSAHEDLSRAYELKSQQLDFLKENYRETQREEKREGVNFKYLKNIVCKYMETEDFDRLYPVLSELLQLTPEDKARLLAVREKRQQDANLFSYLGFSPVRPTHVPGGHAHTHQHPHTLAHQTQPLSPGTGE
eukprot:Rmarinus@m.28285